MNRPNPDEQNIAEEKKQLRIQALTKRQQLSSSQWQSDSRSICSHLANSLLFNNAKTILSYLSFRGEPDLSSIHLQQKYKWGLPRCEAEKLIWHEYDPSKDKLVKGLYGIDEPSIENSIINPSDVDLILVPALMCDRYGHRLGYGGGYYDRLLAQAQWQNMITIGIVFNFAYVAKLPTQSWDKPLHYICTQFGIQKCQTIEEQN